MCRATLESYNTDTKGHFAACWHNAFRNNILCVTAFFDSDNFWLCLTWRGNVKLPQILLQAPRIDFVLRKELAITAPNKCLKTPIASYKSCMLALARWRCWSCTGALAVSLTLSRICSGPNHRPHTRRLWEMGALWMSLAQFELHDEDDVLLLDGEAQTFEYRPFT